MSLLRRFWDAIQPSDGAIVALTVAALGLTIPQWGLIYADNGYRLPIVMAALGSALLSLVLARVFRIVSSLMLSTAVLLALASMWYSADVSQLPADLRSSWKGLASTGLLIATSKTFVLVPVVITWLAAAAVTEIVIRRGPSVAIAFPILAAHAASLAYTISLGIQSRWLVFGLAASLFALIAAGTARQPLASDPEVDPNHEPPEDEEQSPIRWRQVLLAFPAIILVAVVGLVANLALPVKDEQAFDLRKRLTRPITIFDATTPLALLKPALLAEDPALVFTIRVDGLGSADEIRRLPVATLDLFDGAIWTSSAQFETAGALLPDPVQLGANLPVEVTQTVALTDDYPFRFLPRTGTIRTSSQASIGWDPRSGSIIRTDASRGAGVFQNTALLPNLALPESVEVGIPPDFLGYATETPPATADQIPVFESFLLESTDGAGSEFARLQFVEQALRSELFGYNEEAPSGHSLAALTSYLRPEIPGSETVGIRAGFAEQSAAVFAVLARQLRNPSRVVVGYLLPAPITAASPEVEVTEDMIHAWPEVWISGVGWFPFEPTNPGNDTSARVAITPTVSRGRSDAGAADLPELRDPLLIPEFEPADSGLDRRTLGIILLVAAPFMYLLFVVLARRLRTARRRRGDTASQISGAWREIRDRLIELGIPTPPGSTVSEMVDNLSDQDLTGVATPLADMVPLLDSALFSPALPHPAEAIAAWTVTRDAVRAAEQATRPKDRLFATLTPRRLFTR